MLCIFIGYSSFSNMKWLRSFVDLILYGNFWIAACALAMGFQTQLLLLNTLHWTPFLVFLFFGTLFLYAIHRIVGLEKVKVFTEKGRYRVIYQFRGHIWVYAFIGLAVASWLFLFRFSLELQLLLLAPGLLSLAYVLPLFGKKRRLRDFHLLKIFLIALVWAWLTVLLPARELNVPYTPQLWWMLIERMLFIFAITVPFDIRDLSVDAHNQVRTLPAVLGIQASKRLSYLVIGLFCGVAAVEYGIGFYSFAALAGLILSAGFAVLYTALSDRIHHDYFFTALVDGAMILQLLFVWGLMLL
jgi:4-hydroxybenzoate polyprenyltransferase